MNIYDTSTLVDVRRGLPRFTPFLLALYFPEVIYFDTEEIKFDDVGEDLQIAPFVSPMVAGKVLKDKGGNVASFKPAYLKPKHRVDPAKVLRRMPGEAIGGAMPAGARRDAVIADNMIREERSIRLREEAMASEILRTGKVVVEGEDYPKAEVDFARAAGKTKVLAGGAVWGSGTDTPLDDIDNWAAELEAPVTDITMDRLAFQKFKKNQAVKDALDTRRGGDNSLEIGAGNGELVQFKGYLSGNIRIWVYAGYYKDSTGAKVNYLPDNTVILGSRGAQGTRCYGAILDPRAGYMATDAFPKNWISEDPAAEYTMTQSAPLPVLGIADATMAVTVA